MRQLGWPRHERPDRIAAARASRGRDGGRAHVAALEELRSTISAARQSFRCCCADRRARSPRSALRSVPRPTGARSLDTLVKRREESSRRAGSTILAPTHRCTLPGDPLPHRAPAPDHPDPPRHRGRLPRTRLLDRRGPRGREGRLQLRRAQHRRRTRRARARHLLLRRRAVLRIHTSPVQVRSMIARRRRST